MCYRTQKGSYEENQSRVKEQREMRSAIFDSVVNKDL